MNKMLFKESKENFLAGDQVLASFGDNFLYNGVVREFSEERSCVEIFFEDMDDVDIICLGNCCKHYIKIFKI